MNHNQIIELLPWYANETLGESERQMVEAHLAGCSECARELKSLNAMRKVVVEAGNQGPALSPHALNRALAQIEDYERTKMPQAHKASSAAREVKRFWTGWWKPTPIFARALIAAQIAVVLALGSIAVYQHAHPVIEYRTTSGGSAEDKTSARIVIGFSDGATEQEIRQTILGINGKIVDGPSALGLYTVQLATPGEQTTEIEQVLKTLRQNHRVVRFAAQKQ